MPKMKIVGIASCAAGVAHTYIAQEKIIKAAKKLGHDVKIETQGAAGVESELTTTQIKNADIVIIATDVAIDLSRFNGKKLYQAPVGDAVKAPETLIRSAIAKARLYSGDETKDASSNKTGFLKHIMTGVSWMIPLLVGSAVLLAIPNIAGAIVGKSEIVSQGNWAQYTENGLSSGFWKLMYMFMRMGWSSISLMFPIFAGFTAYSIAGKPAFVPGFIGGFLSKPSMYFGVYKVIFDPLKYPYLGTSSGFWGALIIGLFAGYVVKFANNKIKVKELYRAIKPMLLLPLVGIYAVIIAMVFIINPFFGVLNNKLTAMAVAAGARGQYALATVIAPMIAADLGGPINKAAYTAMLSFYEARTISLTMRVIPTVTPSIALGLAAIFDKKLLKMRVFDRDVRQAASNSIILALLGISEGGLPFIFKRPLLTIPINMLGGIIGAWVGIATGTQQWFPDSAIWAWPFAQPVWGYLLGIAAGVLSTMFMHLGLRAYLIKKGKLEIDK